MHSNPNAPGGILIREESVLTFPDGLPGFESAKRFALVTVEEIMAHLHGRTIDGRVVLDDALFARMQQYRAQYGGKD